MSFPFVVIKIPSGPHSLLKTRFVTGVARCLSSSDYSICIFKLFSLYLWWNSEYHEKFIDLPPMIYLSTGIVLEEELHHLNDVTLFYQNYNVSCFSYSVVLIFSAKAKQDLRENVITPIEHNRTLVIRLLSQFALQFL
jgi:hypothetical protein